VIMRMERSHSADHDPWVMIDKRGVVCRIVTRQ